MKKEEKKGLSPVIATVLLVVLVLVLAVIIFLWARSFISEQVEKFGNPVENACDDVDFDVSKSGTGPYTLQLVNRANVNINSFDMKEVKGGSSQIITWEESLGIGKAIEKNYTLQTSNPEKIIVIPRLLGNVKGESVTKVFTCPQEAGKTIEL